MITPRELAPTVGPKSSRVIFRVGSLPRVSDEIAIGRMVAFGGLYFLCEEGYKPALAPVMHAVVVPIGRVNVFVGFTGSVESVGSPSPAELAPDSHANSDNNTLAIASSDDLADDPDSIQPLVDDGGSDDGLGDDAELIFTTRKVAIYHDRFSW